VAPGGKAGSTGAAAQVRLVDLGNRIVRTATVDLEVGRDRLNDTINRATDVVTRAKGIYVGSSTSVPDGEPATGQVTFRVPVAAWRAQERVYLRLLDRAKSIADVIAVQNQLQQVQSNIAEEPVGRLGRAWATAVNGLGVMAAAVLVGVVWLTPVVLMAGLVLFGLRVLRRPRPALGLERSARTPAARRAPAGAALRPPSLGPGDQSHPPTHRQNGWPAGSR
jgi:hypothetical protein